MQEDDEHRSTAIRKLLSVDQRVASGTLAIDPGFINHRRVEGVLGMAGMAVVDEMIRNSPPDLPDWQQRVRIDHIYSRVLLAVCEQMGARPLGVILAERRGNLFCSIEDIAGWADPKTSETRVVNRVITPGVDDLSVELHYSSDMIRATTTRYQLSVGHEMAIIGEVDRLRGNTLIVRPLVMGAPWLTVDESVIPDAEWYGRDFFQNFVEDIDEFSRVKDVPAPSDFSVMEHISESAFKSCLVDILGDSSRKDWGGEMSDHFSAHVTLGGRSTTAAFLLKGPARFAPMGLNHLGKNNDQIYRLSQEPAELLVVQHCHDVLPPVRATLRAFSVQPGRRRRYCVMDGRDSLRLLQAYDMLDRAIELSFKP